MDVQPAAVCIRYATSSKKHTGVIITFGQFEEGDSLSETRNDTESGNESDEDSTLAPIISEK